MSLSNDQVSLLLGMVASAEPDSMDCDGCLGRIAEFAELHIASKEIPEAMRAVEIHIEQCMCCKDEFNALLKGLSAIAG